eukprot:NODE_2075_length_658_cov_194.032015_g2025_i0.p2 GENE.NODE_2075_length_658_cov_194.032015_g2025_i0~~NODE_2075_length_658_cov_194.032015_g2025_i0.p2  ORF type:complete len:156 (+),score=44.60 NODE_2075_length_658_cov_194.032015_g2025_i0:77-544(+)
MSDMEDTEVHTTDAGASETIPRQAGALKKGDHAVLKGKPCKIVDYSTSKTGKHGHAKASIVGLDIFTGKKYEEICPTTHNMLVPVVHRNEFTVTDVNDEGYMVLMDDEGNLTEHLTCPTDEFGTKIKAGLADSKDVLATIQKAMGSEGVCAVNVK